MVYTAFLTLALVLSGVLLAATTYAAIVGLAGAFMGRTYEKCPRCGGHYLADPAQPGIHSCHRGWAQPLHHVVKAFAGSLHHAHVGHG